MSHPYFSQASTPHPAGGAPGNTATTTAAKMGQQHQRKPSQRQESSEMVELELTAQQQKTGKLLASVYPINEHCAWLSPPRFDPTKVPKQVSALNSPIGPHLFTEAMSLIARDIRFNCYCVLFSRIAPAWLIFSVASLLTFLAMSPSGGLLVMVLSLAWFAMLLLGLFFCYVIRKYLLKCLRSVVAEANRITYEHRVLIAVKDEGQLSCHKVRIVLLHYDLAGCIADVSKLIRVWRAYNNMTGPAGGAAPSPAVPSLMGTTNSYSLAGRSSSLLGWRRSVTAGAGFPFQPQPVAPVPAQAPPTGEVVKRPAAAAQHHHQMQEEGTGSRQQQKQQQPQWGAAAIHQPAAGTAAGHVHGTATGERATVQQQQPSSSRHTVGDDSDELAYSLWLEDQARALVLTYVQPYIKALLKRQLLFPTRPSEGVSEFMPKHVQKSFCLCQFIEKEHFYVAPSIPSSSRKLTTAFAGGIGTPRPGYHPSSDHGPVAGPVPSATTAIGGWWFFSRVA